MKYYSHYFSISAEDICCEVDLLRSTEDNKPRSTNVLYTNGSIGLNGMVDLVFFIILVTSCSCERSFF